MGADPLRKLLWPTGVSGRRYLLHEKLVAIGKDFDIVDEHGHAVFHVDGSALHRHTLQFEDADGTRLHTIQRRRVHLRKLIAIEPADDGVVAMVRRRLTNRLRWQWIIDVADGDDLRADGNIIQYEYHIHRGHHRVAAISKLWVGVGDTYGVEIIPHEDDALVLAIIVGIDLLARRLHLHLPRSRSKHLRPRR